jgi:transposase
MQQVADYEREIWRLFTQHADAALFVSIPGAGKRLAPRLRAEWGEDRDRDAGGVQALAGTAPVLWQSGQYRRVPMRLGCVKALRRTLHQLAGDSLQTEAWAKA